MRFRLARFFQFFWRIGTVKREVFVFEFAGVLLVAVTTPQAPRNAIRLRVYALDLLLDVSRKLNRHRPGFFRRVSLFGCDAVLVRRARKKFNWALTVVAFFH